MRLFLLLTTALTLASCAPRLTATQPAPDVVAQLPTPADPAHVRVVVMGDQGKGGAVQKQVAQAMQEVCAAQGCDFGVALGDNFYPAGPKQATSPLFQTLFANLYGPLKIPFLVIAGNHDESWLVGGDGADAAGADAQVEYSKLNPQWVMPARSYRAPVGDLAEFFALDTAPLAPYLPPVRPNEFPNGAWDMAQRAWLAGALGRSTARWKLVLGHHPLFSNGKHGEAGHYDRFPLSFQKGEAARQTYLLACNKADLILSGHVHSLELFAPQMDCPNTWQLISGAAGEAGGPKFGQRPAVFDAFGQPGFAWLDITAQTLNVRFYAARDGKAVQVFEGQIKK